MNVEYVQINKIVPYENNPRINDGAVDFVANSIKEFGFKVPVIIDSDNVIVAGHTRIKAAEKLGMKEVPCIVADDLTPEQIKAYRIADNSVGESVIWDFDKLDDELAELKDFNIEDFGLEGIADTFSYMDNVGFDVDAKESEIFSITFNFPKEYEELVKDYIKNNGKDELADMILSKVKGE